MYNKEQIIEKFCNMHGSKYDYKKVLYFTMHDKVCIICPEHGEFWQEPRSHLNGQGCPICGKIKRAKSKTDTIDNFIKKCINIHGDKYNYDDVVYVNNLTKVKVNCLKHGSFLIRPDMLLQGHGCPICKNEKLSLIKRKRDNTLNEIIKFIQSIDNGIDYEIIDNNEIFFYKNGIAIRVLNINNDNEMFFPNRKHHLERIKKYEEKNAQIIQIYNDEWVNKTEVCKSRIRNIFGKNNIKIYARNCLIKEIDNKTSKFFCSQNHIQGGVNGLINLGLYYNNELISVMNFGNLRKNLGSKKQEQHYELLRFCTKTDLSVIGGASKLFHFFIKQYKPIEVISYADRRWSIGKLYNTIGFKLIKETEPNYFYIVNGVRKNRFSFRKDELIKKYGCSNDDTEHNFCKSNSWYRIYDCGCKVFCWNKDI